MPKSEKVKDITRKAFARAFVDNGGNATKAMLAVKPHLKEASASTEASTLLNDVKVTSAIDSLYASVKDQYMEVMKGAIAHAEKLLVHTNERVQLQAHKILAEYGKLFAPANTVPKTAIQNNRYVLPKR